MEIPPLSNGIDRQKKDSGSMHDLDGQNLASIPADLFTKTELRQLSAKENNLTEISSQFSKLTNLEVLWLHENSIETVSPAIGSLRYLKDLWISNNSIYKLPNEICNLKNLTELQIYSNKLTMLPSEFGNLQALVKLKVGDNQLVGLPSSFFHLTNLTKLDASYNRFAVFPQALPSSLTSIDFSNNKIGGEAPPPNMIPRLPKLRKLRLSRNVIYSVPGEIGSLIYLEEFSIANNHLFTLPPSLGLCTNLRVLNLDDNKIDYLPPEVSIMTRLEKLCVNNNTFLNIPANVVKKGQKAIVKYFQEFRQETRNSSKLKLMVVGQENVGKSTLLQALRNTTKTIPDMATPISTDGIDIVTWKVKLDKTKKIEFSCWDFAGQEVYYNTHQFFLSKGAIYVLVWNLIQPETARLDFWLESIEGSGGGVVVMVGTHASDPMCTPAYMDAQVAFIKEKCLNKHPNIRFVNFVDAKKGSGIEDLKHSLVELAQTLPQFGKAMPSTHIKLEEVVEKEAKSRDPPLVTWQDYKTLAISCSINDEEVLASATQFLHNLGSLIHFSSRHSGLSDLVILKPQFLPDLMCTIISTKTTFIRNGVLDHKDLSLIWKKYNPKLYSQFILLLEKFGLLCRLQEEASSNRLSLNFPSSPKSNSQPLSPLSSSASAVSPPSPTLTRTYSTLASPPSVPNFRKRLSFIGGTDKNQTRSLDAEKSLIPLLLEHNPEIDRVMALSLREGTLGRDFHFRILIPALFPRLIVSVLTYSRLSTRRGNRWKVEYGKDQLYVARRASFSLATFDHASRKLSVRVWGINTTRMLTLITQSVEFLLEDCFPNVKFTISVVCPHCLANHVHVPKSWPLSDLETRLATEGDMATVMCDKVAPPPDLSSSSSMTPPPSHYLPLDSSTPPRSSSYSAPSSPTYYPTTPTNFSPSCPTTPLSSTAIPFPSLSHESSPRSPDLLSSTGDRPASIPTVVPIREMVPDLALNDVAKIKFEDITIECQVGEGAFGEIYKAKYNGRTVAIKQLRIANEGGAENKDVFKEFVREVAFMSEMNCPEIVQLLGVSLKPLAMMQEFMDMGDLQKFLRNNPRLDIKTATQLAFDIAKGCQFLHARTPPCIHADLKSPNILMRHHDKGGIAAKLGDLGLSRSVFAPLNKRMVDNPRWLAPEILSNQEYNEMADVYSYAIIVWEIMVTHLDKYQEPFQEYNVTFDSQLENHILQGLRPSIPPGVPPELATLINECWQPNYFERPTFDGVSLTLLHYSQRL